MWPFSDKKQFIVKFDPTNIHTSVIQTHITNGMAMEGCPGHITEMTPNSISFELKASQGKRDDTVQRINGWLEQSNLQISPAEMAPSLSVQEPVAAPLRAKAAVSR